MNKKREMSNQIIFSQHLIMYFFLNQQKTAADNIFIVKNALTQSGAFFNKGVHKWCQLVKYISTFPCF